MAASEANSPERRLAKAKKHDGGKPLAVSTLEAAARLRIGQTLMRELIRDRKVKTIKIGRSLRITVKSIEKLVAQLEKGVGT
jgi:excisionase family DNA binding protein